LAATALGGATGTFHPGLWYEVGVQSTLRKQRKFRDLKHIPSRGATTKLDGKAMLPDARELTGAPRADNEGMDAPVSKMPLFAVKAKSNDKRLDKQELRTFVEITMSNRSAPYKRVIIGDIVKDAQARIERKCHVTLERINIDNQNIIHAMGKAAHNLEPDDLIYAVDTINTSTDITVSPYKHLSTTVLVFKKNMGGGEFTVLAEVHPKGSYLLVFDAWRQKKARRSSTANMPRANVQNGSSYADTPLSP
jgi:hypothetical protein